MKQEYKIFCTDRLPDIDRYTIEHEPVKSVDLMERAAWVWVGKVEKKFSQWPSFAVVAGSGNNGGDGFAIARLLQQRGADVKVYHLPSSHLSADCLQNRERWKGKCVNLESVEDFQPAADAWIIDALFGTGLNRKLTGLAAELVKKINLLPNRVLAVDMPSGLMGENNADNDPEAIVKASYTYTFQFPKLAFMFAENEKYVGKWEVLDIKLHPRIIAETVTPYYYLLPGYIRSLLPSAKIFAHKGINGYGVLVAGSYGMMGGAVLAAKAAVRSGIGLLSCHIPERGMDIMQISVPEALTDADVSGDLFSEIEIPENCKAVAVGPALGKRPETVAALEKLLRQWQGATVLDADALNILSEHRNLLDLLHPQCILTPHPKEFERLAGKSRNDFERLNNLSNFANHYRVTVLLKGAHTVIASPSGKCYFNMSGNPGMAKGGMGDVLTGVLLALLANGLMPLDAACIGVYAHGLAGDQVAVTHGMRGVCAGEVAEQMGKAWKMIESE